MDIKNIINIVYHSYVSIYAFIGLYVNFCINFIVKIINV